MYFKHNLANKHLKQHDTQTHTHKVNMRMIEANQEIQEKLYI